MRTIPPAAIAVAAGTVVAGLTLPLLGLVAILPGIVCGALVGGLLAPPSGAQVGAMLVGAAVGGGAGFLGGFLGPILWLPEANQGPLLGIFITGPLGVLLGAGTGWAIGRREPAGPRA